MSGRFSTRLAQGTLRMRLPLDLARSWWRGTTVAPDRSVFVAWINLTAQKSSSGSHLRLLLMVIGSLSAGTVLELPG